MGSGLSCSCCSGDAPDNKEVIQRSDSSTEPDYHFAPPETRQFDVQPALQKPTRSESFYSDSKTPAINVDVDHFRRRLEESITVIVLLADGRQLSCGLQISQDNTTLIISCEQSFRPVRLSDVKSILCGKDQLRRVDTKALLLNDTHCVALHLVTGNCIPVRFSSLQDKLCFITLIEKLKEKLAQ